jgi:hypothetical protein
VVDDSRSLVLSERIECCQDMLKQTRCRSGRLGREQIFFGRMMDSPESPKVFSDFWTLAYAAME